MEDLNHYLIQVIENIYSNIYNNSELLVSDFMGTLKELLCIIRDSLLF